MTERYPDNTHTALGRGTMKRITRGSAPLTAKTVERAALADASFPGVLAAPAKPALIRLQEVVKVYRTPAGDFPALKGITMDFRTGEFVTIVGKSGSGKSTLVNVVTGVDGLTSGEIWIDDTPVHALSENEMALWRGHTIGVVYQSFELLPQLSLLDNVLLPMDLCGLYRGRQSVARAKALLAQVGLESHMYKEPSRISGGQKQRVAIARALANDPPIIVADEPTGNLDSATADEIYALFAELIRGGKTILMVTHDKTLATRSPRTLTLQDGVLEHDTTGGLN